MRRHASRTPVAAGDTRSRFGHALDIQLPLPEHRRRFRRWRHTRPFWAGLLVIVAGILLISYPIGPWPQMVALGSAAFTGMAIGLILIIGGLFLWFAPHQRLFLSLVLMICSILALVASNLGGFLVGTALGMLGSAMAFGWREGDYKRKGAPVDATKTPRPKPGPGSSATNKTAAIAAVALLVASSMITGLRAAPALAQQQWPGMGCGETRVNSATVKGQVKVMETVTLRSPGGCSVRASRIFVIDATLSRYHLQSPRTSTGEVMQLLTDVHLVNTELFATELYADIKLGALIDVPLPIDPPLPTGVFPITPDLVDVLGTLGLLPLPLNLDATDAALGQPLAISENVEISNAVIRVMKGPTITVP